MGSEGFFGVVRKLFIVSSATSMRPDSIFFSNNRFVLFMAKFGDS